LYFGVGIPVSKFVTTGPPVLCRTGFIIWDNILIQVK